MKTGDLLKQANENKGESSNSSADKIFENEKIAARVFSELKTKLLKINKWNDHALMSSYALFDEKGNEINEINVGDFIRISLKASGKYDWIRVIECYDQPDEFVITVKPTFDPTDENVDRKVISHFFTDEATNNFCLFRTGEKVAFYVIGLSERSNTDETGGTLETIRNAAVNLATYLGMQKSEWEKFCHHFMEDAAEEIQNKTSG
ncbi:hypothetical protein BH20ACI4_BH20ACI4_01830 [soil metagenome]